MDTDYAECSRYLNEVISLENDKEKFKIELDNRKVKLQEIADILKIFKYTIFCTNVGV